MQPGAGGPLDCHRKDRPGVFMNVITVGHIHFQPDTEVVDPPGPYGHPPVHMYVSHISSHRYTMIRTLHMSSESPCFGTL